MAKTAKCGCGGVHGQLVDCTGGDNQKMAVAKEFCKVLHEWLTPTQLKEAVRLNKTKTYKNCCASHDFCDANMAMYLAFHNLGLRANIDCDGWDKVNTDQDFTPVMLAAEDVWNAAWDDAKAASFKL